MDEAKVKEVKGKGESSREGEFTDMQILQADGKSYIIGGRKVFQKPLVLRDFGKLFELFINFIGVVAASNPELLNLDANKQLEFTPQFLIGLAHSSSEATEKVHELLALILKEDKEFLLDNMGISQFTEILADAILLNDIKEIAENFRKMASRVRGYLKQK